MLIGEPMGFLIGQGVVQMVCIARGRNRQMPSALFFTETRAFEDHCLTDDVALPDLLASAQQLELLGAHSGADVYHTVLLARYRERRQRSKRLGRAPSGGIEDHLTRGYEK